MALSKLSLNWRLFPVASRIQLHNKSAFRKWSKSFFANVVFVVSKQIQSDYFVLSFCCCFQTDSKWLFCFALKALVEIEKNWSNISSTYNLFFLYWLTSFCVKCQKNQNITNVDQSHSLKKSKVCLIFLESKCY